MALIEPTNQQKIAIFEEINESNVNKLEENKKIIKQWLNLQPHLPKNYDERIISLFIRGCKHDIERVQRKLDCYFTYRTTMPDLFKNRDPTSPEIKHMRDYFVAIPLPELTSEGCRVTLHRITSGDPILFDIKVVVKYLLMVGEIRLIEEGPITGDIILFDVGYAKASITSKIIHPVVKKGIMCTQNALPQRVKELHIINAPPYMDKAVNIFKMFVKPKIRGRFHVYTGTEGLRKYIPQEMLPSDYGGKEKSVDALQSEWLKKLESYRTYFAEQENVYVDESKRINKPEIKSAEYEELFGSTGSFHKLSID